MTYAVKSPGYSRNAGKRWRGSDVAELRALARKGAPLRLISLKLGRPDSAIRAKANALGLTVASGEPVIARPPMRTLTRTARTPHQAGRRQEPQPDLFADA